MPAKVADRLLDDKVWLGALSNEIGERMLNGPLRNRLAMLLTSMLHQRAVVTGEAMAILHGALGELKQDWRLTHGGPDHAPTDTETLLRIVDRAERMVTNSEAAIQRAIKLALDEQRAAAEYADGIGPSLYSGQAEKVGPLGELPAGDREAIRILTNKLARTLAKRREPVDTHARVVTPHPPGGTPAPTPSPGAAPHPPGGTPGQVPGEHGNDAIDVLSLVRTGPAHQPPAPGDPHPTPGQTMPSSTARQRPHEGGGQDGGTPPTVRTSMRTSTGAPPRGSSKRSASSFDPNVDESPAERAFFGDDDEASARAGQKRAKKKRAQRKKAAASKRKKGSAGAQPKKATKKTKVSKARKRGKKTTKKKRGGK